jgi:hypothetical protein
MRHNRITPDVGFVGMIKGSERYIVIFDYQYLEQAKQATARWAFDPSLSLTKENATILMDAIRIAGEKMAG